MKIIGIKTLLCHAYRTNWVFVKVMTDSGIHGWGEATLETREKTVAQAVQELERYLIGRDPNDIESFWYDMYRESYWRSGPVLMTALRAKTLADRCTTCWAAAFVNRCLAMPMVGSHRQKPPKILQKKRRQWLRQDIKV